jgi:UDP-N-acetylmuramoyl-tripeptide--D-alanyl-D-alanine ligase
VSHTPERLPEGAPLLIVDDTMAALEALAGHARERSTARIAGITGSVGKTGTKEALRIALSAQGLTSASLASLNNYCGVPLSLARMPQQATYGIFEIGMNHAGEIVPLSRMVRPDVAIVTAVEPAHTEFFASLEAVADAKAEIFTGMVPGGSAVLNRDSPFYDRLAEAARAHGIDRIIGFGAHERAEVRLLNCTLGAHASDISATMDGTPINYRLGVPGRHWVINSLAVLAAAQALGADAGRAATALANMVALDGRGRSHEVRLGDSGFTVVDECYNASPASVRAALETLAAMEPGAGGRRIAVLGDMRELGKQSAALHTELAEVVRANGIDLVFTAGADMAHLSGALPQETCGAHAETADRIAPVVMAALRPGDIVTVKGSLASDMRIVVEALLGLGGEAARVVNG